MQGHIVGLWVSQHENGVSAKPGDSQSCHTSGNAEQQAFDQDLTNDSESGCSKSHTNGDIDPSGRGTRPESGASSGPPSVRTASISTGCALAEYPESARSP